MDKWEKEHIARVRRHMEQIKRIFNRSTDRLALKASKVKFNGEVFNWNTQPKLRKMINDALKELHSDIYTTVVSGISEQWNFSNKKNNLIVANRVGEGAPDWLFDPNEKAMQQFIKRADRGMNLSNRVWRGLGPHREMLEMDLGLGIMEGTSAKSLATRMKEHLNEPDKLFRRVRNAEGKLVLSKAAKAYHPGRGVYRSSYKNALRLTATETNMAYRTADHERWKTLPFVVGVEVRLSAQHPRPDICDNLKGRYPKNFLFRGWHPFCICYAVPVMISDSEYDKMEEAILAGKRIAAPKNSLIKQPPEGFKKYIAAHRGKLAENPPYWYSDNKAYTKKG